MKAISSGYYDASYFAWQCPGGEFAAVLDRWKFEPFIQANDVVLDFGCGGGFLLGALQCKERFGVEVNAAAREAAARHVRVYPGITDLPDGVRFDVIISHHALEHVDRPLDVLRELASRLVPTGRMVFVVPSESWHDQRRYGAGDINQHIYTWTPLTLGNLFSHAGLDIQRVELLSHTWLPWTKHLRKFIPLPVYHVLCRLWALLTGRRQIRIVAFRNTMDQRIGV